MCAAPSVHFVSLARPWATLVGFLAMTAWGPSADGSSADAKAVPGDAAGVNDVGVARQWSLDACWGASAREGNDVATLLDSAQWSLGRRGGGLGFLMGPRRASMSAAVRRRPTAATRCRPGYRCPMPLGQRPSSRPATAMPTIRNRACRCRIGMTPAPLARSNLLRGAGSAAPFR